MKTMLAIFSAIIAAASGAEESKDIALPPHKADEALVFTQTHDVWDWAVMKAKAGAETWQPASGEFPEKVVHAGYFNESWKPPAAP